MFPATAVKTENEDVKGSAFGYRIDHTGLIETRRTVTIDREAWEDCAQCHDLDSCFRPSSGTLLMEIAVRS
jgi:hypothetical protein